jgi:hypothetical protein
MLLKRGVTRHFPAFPSRGLIVSHGQNRIEVQENPCEVEAVQGHSASPQDAQKASGQAAQQASRKIRSESQNRREIQSAGICQIFSKNNAARQSRAEGRGEENCQGSGT